MLLLHAAQVREDFLLWAEDTEPDPGAPGQDAPGKHPSCAPAQRLAEAVGLNAEDSPFTKALAWLPTTGGTPIPSSPMAGPMPKSRTKPRIRPWSVTAISLSPDLAVPLLQACQGRRILQASVAIGPDLAYWAHALRLAVSLTARQQFLPGLN